MFNSKDSNISLKHNRTGEEFPAVSLASSGNASTLADFIREHTGDRTHVFLNYNNNNECYSIHIGNGKECVCPEQAHFFEDAPHGGAVIFYDKDRKFNVSAFGSKNLTNLFVLTRKNKAFKEFTALK